MQILTRNISSISELKANPMKVLEDAGGEAVTILNHNKPVFYCVPVEEYKQQHTPQWHLDRLEELENMELEFHSFDEVFKELKSL